MNKSLRENVPMIGVLLSISGASFFALSLVSARLTYDHGTNTQTIMLVRFACVMLMMLAWNRSKNIPINIESKDIIKSAGLGIFYFIGIGAYLSSVVYMPAGLAVLILYTFPIWVIVITTVLEKHKPSKIQFLALIIAFVGLFIALDIRGDTTKPLGILLAATAALGVTINMVGSASILKRIAFSQFSLYQATMVTVISAVLITFTGGLALPNSPQGWVVFAVMLISFFIAYFSVYISLKLIGAIRTSTIMNLEPVMTSVFAFLLLQEELTANKITGGLIVIAAILLAQLAQVRKSKKGHPPTL